MDPALAMEVAALSQRRAVDEATELGNSEIQKFYENSVIFVTGGSGFLGKQMIEKLLRSCKINKIFMLLRPKKGKSPRDRLTEIFDDPVFQEIRKKQPDFVSKIHVVNGDITELQLGLSEEDWTTITHEVEIIFHGAATIGFVKPIKEATITNVRGTREVLRLGKQCKNLKSFVHISTAYSNATSSRFGNEVFEKFYSTPVPSGTMIDLVESVDEKVLDEMTPKLLQDWPNTYAFTKAIAEDTVRTMSEEMPVCIVRPAIVICCIREPAPGWIDKSCVFGPSGLVLGLGTGVIHVMQGNLKTVSDLVPADYVNNAVIAAGWETNRRFENGEKETKIYTMTGSRNPITNDEIEKYFYELRPLVSPKAVWYCWNVTTKIKFMYLFWTWLFHYIPAYIIDTGCRIIGKKPQFVKIYTKIYNLSSIFSYFTNNEWKFKDDNLRALYDKMSPADKQIYNFDIMKLDRSEQVNVWYLGLRKYIMKDNLTGTKEAVRKQGVFKILHYITVGLYIFLWWIVLRYSFSAVNYVYSLLL